MEYQPPIGGDADDPYVDANPGIGLEGSAVPAAAIEAPQREIVAVIEAAGLDPDEDDNEQLLEAITNLIAAAAGGDASETVKGLIEIATQIETDAGADDARAVTPLKVKGTIEGVARTYTKPQRAARATPAYAASLTLDFGATQNFVVGDLTGNITLNNPSNIAIDQAGVITLKQDGTGGRTLALGAYFKTEDDEAIDIAIGAGQVTELRYYVRSTTEITITPISNPS